MREIIWISHDLEPKYSAILLYSISSEIFLDDHDEIIWVFSESIAIWTIIWVPWNLPQTCDLKCNNLLVAERKRSSLLNTKWYVLKWLNCSMTEQSAVSKRDCSPRFNAFLTSTAKWLCLLLHKPTLPKARANKTARLSHSTPLLSHMRKIWWWSCFQSFPINFLNFKKTKLYL